MPHRIVIETFENPVVVLATQPGEPQHRKVVAANSGYEFMAQENASVTVEPVTADDLRDFDSNQHPTPADKPHAGQTSATSGLQPEAPEITAQRTRDETSDTGGAADDEREDGLPKDRDVGTLYE